MEFNGGWTAEKRGAGGRVQQKVHKLLYRGIDTYFKKLMVISTEVCGPRQGTAGGGGGKDGAMYPRWYAKTYTL